MKGVFRNLVLVVIAFAVSASTAFASVIQPDSMSIDGNEVKTRLTVSPSIVVDVRVEFDQVIGLNEDSFSISAEQLSPLHYSITNRLPAGNVSVSNNFPVIVSITPDPASGFAFEGLAYVEIYTKAIHYTPAQPFRLFTSHAGGTFDDITTTVSAGSIRAGGNTGKFSDFLILLDNRPTATILNAKIQNIASLLGGLSAQSVPGLSALTSTFNLLELAVNTGDYAAALTLTETLLTDIDNATIASVWRADDALQNSKGELMSNLYTLRYNLRVL